MNNKVSSVLVIATCFFAVSCGEAEAPDANPVEDNKEAVVEEVEVSMEEIDEPEFIIPSALQISAMFNNSGLTYIDGITNSPDKVSDYNSKFEKLLNFGVYSGDLFYCILNDQTQMSIQYLKAVRQLADETGMAGIFNTGPLFERFESNIGNKDSVFNIMLEFQEKTDVLIAENNEEHTAMVIFAGAWTEGMYIGLDAVKNTGNENLKARLAEQMSIVGNLIKGLQYQPNRNDASIAYEAKYQAILDYFMGIDGVKGADEYSYDETALADEDWKALYEMVRDLRNEITKS